jgi:hypothetical protein
VTLQTRARAGGTYRLEDYSLTPAAATIRCNHNQCLYPASSSFRNTAPRQLNAELPPVTPPSPAQHLLRNRLFQQLPVSLAELPLHHAQMPRFPVKPHQTRYQQLGPLLAGPRLAERLVQEQSVAHGAVDYPVQDVREGFALPSVSLAFLNARDLQLTTRFCDFAIISRAKLRRYRFS